MHCRRGTMPERHPWSVRNGQPSNDKKRVPVPVEAEPPHALADRTGRPEGITARRTPRALAQSSLWGKVARCA